MRTIGLALLAVVALRAELAYAQAIGPARSDTYFASGAERWRYSAQRPLSAPWQRIEGITVPLDSMSRNTVDGSTVFRSHARSGTSIIYHTAWRGRDGAIDSLALRIDSASARPPAALRSALAPAISDDFRFGSTESAISMFPMFFGAVPPTGRRTPIRIVVRTARADRTIEGQFASRLIGDTVVRGQRLQIIRDSGEVTITTRSSYYERTLFAERQDDRRVRGAMYTRRLFDPVRGVTVHVADSLALVGTETRRYPDGRVYSSPVHFDRHRVVELLDSTGLRERRVEQSRTSGYGVGMIVRLPVGAPVVNVADTRIQDSLVRAHALASSHATRDSIERVRGLLTLPGLRERLAHTYAAAGDTARALSMLSLERNDQLTVWTYRMVRPLLDDPGVALRFGISANELYEAFEYAFKYSPLALAKDTLHAWCEPAACRLVATEWPRAREPRLRYVGLMARYSLDPATWADTVIRLAAAGARPLAAMSQLARGVRFARPNEPELEIPAASADWTRWLSWLRGADDATLARRDSVDAARNLRTPLFLQNAPLRIINANDAATHVRLAERRFKVSYGDSLSRRYATATSDSARYVYGILLNAIGAPTRPAAVLLSAMRSPSALDAALARAEMPRLAFAAADSATARTIEQTMLGRLIDGGPLWEPLEASRQRSQGPLSQIGNKDSVYVLADSLGALSVAQLRNAGIAHVRRPWQFPETASGRQVTIGGVYRAGPFVRITVSDTYLVRLADGRGGGNASGGTFYLALVDGTWRVVAEEWWVT